MPEPANHPPAGLSGDWDKASVSTPDISYRFTRKKIRTPIISHNGSRLLSIRYCKSMLKEKIRSVKVNGVPATWQSVNRPMAILFFQSRRKEHLQPPLLHRMGRSITSYVGSPRTSHRFKREVGCKYLQREHHTPKYMILRAF